MKILIVDDFSTMRRIIKNLLRDLVHQHRRGGRRHHRTADAEKRQLRFLVTDWNMPGMSGIDLLRTVRADERLKHLPVLMVTAEAKRDQIIEAAQAGVNGYVVKPFTAQCSRKRSRRSSSASTAEAVTPRGHYDASRPKPGRVRSDSEANAPRLIESLQQGRFDEATQMFNELNQVRNNGLYQEVGKLTRELHNAIVKLEMDTCATGGDPSPITDATDRLSYVVEMTEKAANRTMDWSRNRPRW